MYRLLDTSEFGIRNFLSFITFIYLGVCTCMFLHATVLMYELIHPSALWAQGSNVGHQTWQQAPLPAVETSGQPRNVIH